MIDHTILMDVGVTLDMLHHILYYARLRSWENAEQQLAQFESNFHFCLCRLTEQGMEEFPQLIVFGDCIDLALRISVRNKDPRVQRIRDRLGCLSALVRGMWNQLPTPNVNLLDEPRPQPMRVFRMIARYSPASVISLASGTLIELNETWSVLMYLRKGTLVTPCIPKNIGEYLLHCSEHPSALQYQLSPSGVSLARDLRIGKRMRAIVYQIGTHPRFRHRAVS